MRRISYEQYYQSTRISNSTLSRLINPAVVSNGNSSKGFIKTGSLVDYLLTDKSRIKTDFYITSELIPTGMMKVFIDNMPSEVNAATDLYAAYKASGYTISYTVAVNKFFKEESLQRYYALLRKSAGKTIVSRSEYIKAKIIADNVIEFAGQYFTDKTEHQVAVFFEYLGEDCKALLDGVIINHEEKTILPFDLKTTYSVNKFLDSILKYGYYRQAAFYLSALFSEESPYYTLIKEGYKILPFRFVAVQSEYPYDVRIFEMSENDIVCGLEGGYVGKTRYYGINELMAVYEYRNNPFIQPYTPPYIGDYTVTKLFL